MALIGCNRVCELNQGVTESPFRWGIALGGLNPLNLLEARNRRKSEEKE